MHLYGNQRVLLDSLFFVTFTTIAINSALDDANSAIKLNPDWPKGYFLKAKALVGLSVS